MDNDTEGHKNVVRLIRTTRHNEFLEDDAADYKANNTAGATDRYGSRPSYDRRTLPFIVRQLLQVRYKHAIRRSVV